MYGHVTRAPHIWVFFSTISFVAVYLLIRADEETHSLRAQVLPLQLYSSAGSSEAVIAGFSSPQEDSRCKTILAAARGCARSAGPRRPIDLPVSLQPPVPSVDSHDLQETLREPKRVFFDLGAKQGDIVAAFLGIGPFRSRTAPLYGRGAEGDWDVWAFEANPVYDDLLTSFAARVRVELLDARHNNFHVFPSTAVWSADGNITLLFDSMPDAPSPSPVPDAGSAAVVDVASHPVPDGPAGPGDDHMRKFRPIKSKLLPLSKLALARRTRGGSGGSGAAGGSNGAPPPDPVGRMVQAVDLSRILLERFLPEDTVVVNMDIAGSELEVLRRIITTGAVALVDEFYVRFYNQHLPAVQEQERVLRWLLGTKLR